MADNGLPIEDGNTPVVCDNGSGMVKVHAVWMNTQLYCARAFSHNKIHQHHQLMILLAYVA